MFLYYCTFTIYNYEINLYYNDDVIAIELYSLFAFHILNANSYF